MSVGELNPSDCGGYEWFGDIDRLFEKGTSLIVGSGQSYCRHVTSQCELKYNSSEK